MHVLVRLSYLQYIESSEKLYECFLFFPSLEGRGQGEGERLVHLNLFDVGRCVTSLNNHPLPTLPPSFGFAQDRQGGGIEGVKPADGTFAELSNS